jgi:hypothetical protein
VQTCFFDTTTSISYVSGANSSGPYMYQSTDFLQSWSPAVVPSLALFTSGVVNEIVHSSALQLYIFATVFGPSHFYYATQLSGIWTGVNVAGYSWTDAIVEATNVVVGDSTVTLPTVVPPVLRVGGNLYVDTTITIPTKSMVSVAGSLVVSQQGAIVYSQGATPIAVSQLIVASSATLQVQIDNASSVGAASPVTVVVATYAIPTHGAFSSVTALAAVGSSACLVAQPDYQATTLTVVVSLSQAAACSGSGSELTGGAVAGIAVGCVFAGAALAVFIALFLRHMRRERTRVMNAALAQKHASTLGTLVA